MIAIPQRGGRNGDVPLSFTQVQDLRFVQPGPRGAQADYGHRYVIVSSQPGPVEETLRQTTVLAATAGAAAILLLAACGSSSSNAPSSSSSSSSSSAATSAPAGSASASGTSLLACMVTDTGGINDKSFNQSAWEGMQQAAAANSNVTIRNIQSIPPNTDYARNINTFISQKCGIIVTVGFAMGDATQAAAGAHPSQDFAIVDNAYSPTIPNVDALVFNTVQDGFLGGYLAAGMSKTG